MESKPRPIPSMPELLLELCRLAEQHPEFIREQMAAESFSWIPHEARPTALVARVIDAALYPHLKDRFFTDAENTAIASADDDFAFFVDLATRKLEGAPAMVEALIEHRFIWIFRDFPFG